MAFQYALCSGRTRTRQGIGRFLAATQECAPPLTITPSNDSTRLGCFAPKKAFASKCATSILDNIELLDTLPLEDVRNMCILAHIDHGKSSLASRILERTGNLGGGRDGGSGSGCDSENGSGRGKEKIDVLDTLSVEVERGITVKATAASMLYRHPSAVGPTGCLLLNMVDTPGHADFGMEVSRSLTSVEGAVLLFDAAQGVQAQTLSVYEKANALGIKIIPALTKIDLPSARPVDVALSVSDFFDGFDPDAILKTSARSNVGIEDVLEAVCSEVPPPLPLPDDDGTTLRAKVVDSWFESLRGVVCLVQIMSGRISEGDRISVVDPGAGDDKAQYTKETYSTQELGITLPRRLRTGKLTRGQLGYIILGLRDPRQSRAGSVLVLSKDLPAVADMFMPRTPSSLASSKSVLYASVHPMQGDGFDELAAAVTRLALNDTGLEIHKTSGSSNNNDGGPFLGPGLRVGFQGLLHVEVFRQRLLDEHGLEAIVTPPKVPYTIRYLPSQKHAYKRQDDAPEEEVIEDLQKWPAHGQRFKVLEPIVQVRIMAPVEYAGNIMELVKRRRGFEIETTPIDEFTWIFSSNMPWGEVVSDFYDELKTTSAGYASFDTADCDVPLKEANLCKVDVLLNGDVVDPMAFVCHKEAAQRMARVVCKKLQDSLPMQNFVTVIQAKAEGKIIASERIRAYRKDVLSIGGGKTVGGGDITRKKKLLEKQKKGKKKQQTSGRVQLSQECFNACINRSK